MTKMKRKQSSAKRALAESKKRPNSNEAIRELGEAVLTLVSEVLSELDKAEEKKSVLDKALILLYEHDQNMAQSKMFVPSRNPSKLWPGP